jgi:Uri superfamily endonuclease
LATYAVIFELERCASLRVGALGTFPLLPGCYIYVGQARRGVRQRVARHFRWEKRQRWHVDYLGQVATPVECWLDEAAENVECRWAAALASLPAAARPVARFGASDCRCPGHLVYLPQHPGADRIRAALPISSGDGAFRWTPPMVAGAARHHDGG